MRRVELCKDRRFADTFSYQYAVDPARVDDFYFKLNQPERQIEAHVDSIVRSQIPMLDLDAAFAAKDE